MDKPILARRSGLQHTGVVPQNRTHLRHLLAEPASAEAPALRKASGGGAMRGQASSLADERLRWVIRQ
jgi:hypothetical protein